MAKNFTLQDDENFCIFGTKDRRQTIIILHRVSTGFDGKSCLEFLILDCNI